jgi:hypothetical protein
MERFLFAPIGIVAGLLAGFLGKVIFDQIWGLIDDEEPPEPEHREISAVKMVMALAIQGAIFRAVRGATEHAARSGFQRVTGRWPGEERPEPE